MVNIDADNTVVTSHCFSSLETIAIEFKLLSSHHHVILDTKFGQAQLTHTYTEK